MQWTIKLRRRIINANLMRIVVWARSAKKVYLGYLEPWKPKSSLHRKSIYLFWQWSNIFVLEFEFIWSLIRFILIRVFWHLFNFFQMMALWSGRSVQRLNIARVRNPMKRKICANWYLMQLTKEICANSVMKITVTDRNHVLHIFTQKYFV